MAKAAISGLLAPHCTQELRGEPVANRQYFLVYTDDQQPNARPLAAYMMHHRGMWCKRFFANALVYQ